MKKLFETTKKESEQRIIDMELFALLFPVFDSMSKIGKEVTIDTLILSLKMEEE